MAPMPYEDNPVRRMAAMEPVQLLGRIRAIVGTLDLDCACRGKLDAALERFEALDTRRQLRSVLLDAQHQTERIAVLLELVGELGTIGSDETDLGVYDEITLLFHDIGAAAEAGAADMARARGLAAARRAFHSREPD